MKKAIQDSNFDIVFDNLRDLVEELDGYKSVRAEQDLGFLKKRKDRYYTEKEDYRIHEKPRKEVAES